MFTGKHIGVIGAGNMAQALISGWLTSKLLDEKQVCVSDVQSDKLDEAARKYGVSTHTDNGEVTSSADVVVLAVKPQSASAALAACGNRFKSGASLVSLVAGCTTAALESAVPATLRVVRAMPNTPALVRAGATALAKGSRATDEDIAYARALFDAVGKTVVLPESQIDAVTGLSGSGPGYVMLIIEALADGGVDAGLSRETAMVLAAQTVFGSAKLLLETGEHPARLKDQVASPGGTTIAGLYALEAAGLRSAMMQAVRSATERARELGEKR